MGDHRRCASEHGAIVVLVAVMIVPLVAVAALAVDGAVWRWRSAAVQRAADAAALSGAGASGDRAAVLAVARGVAADNGYAHGIAGVTVEVDTDTPAQVAVTITDPRVRPVLSAPFTTAPAITRAATAERVAPVALGSPRNFLGTANLAGNPDPYRGLTGVNSASAEGFWLSVSGPCAGREQGDLVTAVSAANYLSGNPPEGVRPWRGCTSVADPAVQMVDPVGPGGYLVAMVVPWDYPGGPFTIQVYDAARCADSPADNGARDDSFWTRMRVHDAATSSLAPTSSAVLATEVFATGVRCADDPLLPRGFECSSAGSWKARWCNLATIAQPIPGATYHLHVDTGPVFATARHQLNSFAVRVRAGPRSVLGSFVACTTDPSDTAVTFDPSGCIGVHGVGWMGVFALGQGPSPSFYLAEVGPEHSGSTMEVSLFDIGEGSVAVELLDPLGSPVGFSWRVDDGGRSEVPPTGGMTGVVTAGGSLDTRGNTVANPCGSGNLQPGPGRNSSSKYNDRLLRLNVALPDDIAGAFGGRRWWKVRYRPCEERGISDRTTWGVRIDGQPLRLVR